MMHDLHYQEENMSNAFTPRLARVGKANSVICCAEVAAEVCDSQEYILDVGWTVKPTWASIWMKIESC
jgi:hypothetical protein